MRGVMMLCDKNLDVSTLSLTSENNFISSRLRLLSRNEESRHEAQSSRSGHDDTTIDLCCTIARTRSGARRRGTRRASRASRTSGASGGRRCQRSRRAVRLLKDANILDLEVSVVVVARSLNKVQARTRASLSENVQSEVSANCDVLEERNYVMSKGY